MVNPKPFLYYKLPGGRRVVPQTGLGWAIFVGVMIIALVPVVAQGWILPRFPNFLVFHLILMPIVLIAFVVIAVRNADVIDLRSDAADLAEFRAWQAERAKRPGRK